MITTLEVSLAEQVLEMKTCHEIYNYLKKRCAPSNENRKIETRRHYQKLCRGPVNQKFETWVDEWYIWYNKANILSLTDENNAMEDFANALNSFEESLPDHLALSSFDSIDDMVSVSIKCVRDEFGTHKKTKSSKVSFSSPTLNERLVKLRKQQSGKQKYDRKCLCGKRHNFEDCYYLNQGKSPEGRKSFPDVMAKIEDAFRRDPTLKTEVETRIGHKVNLKPRNQRKRAF